MKVVLAVGRLRNDRKNRTLKTEGCGTRAENAIRTALKAGIKTSLEKDEKNMCEAVKNVMSL